MAHTDKGVLGNSGVACSVGVDLFIGEENYLARRHGPEMLRDFMRHVVPDKYPGAQSVVSSPSVDNNVSIGAFEKAGFTRGITFPGEDGREQLLIIAL